MSALTRYTRSQIDDADAEQIIAEVCAAVSVRGPVALREYAKERAWSGDVLWNWMHEEDGRRQRYEAARRYRGEMCAGETLGIADGSEDPKLMVDTRWKFAEKTYPEVYGPRMKVEREVSVVDQSALLLGMVELLKLARIEQVVEQEPMDEI